MMKDLITKEAKDLITKEAFIWLYYHNRILKISRGFQNKLRAYFSNMYKDIIKNEFKFDYDKWLNELVKLYSEEVTKGLNLGMDRGYKELSADEIALIDRNVIKNNFANFIAVEGYLICSSIMKTTEKYLDQINMISDEKEKKEKLNKLFENWKSWRAKTIAKTEIYRSFNYSYLEMMKMGGYTYKKWFTPPSESNCEACNKLSGKIVGINSAFGDTDERNRLWSGQYPPVHPNDDCMLFALKLRLVI